MSSCISRNLQISVSVKIISIRKCNYFLMGENNEEVFFLEIVVALIRAVFSQLLGVPSSVLARFGCLFRQKHGLDVWKNSALSDGNST